MAQQLTQRVLLLLLLRRQLRLPPLLAWQRCRPLLRAGLPLAMASLLSALVLRLDLFLLQRWHGLAAVSFYAVPATWFLFAAFLPESINSTLYPIVARLGPEGGPALAGLLGQAAESLIAVAAPIAVGASLFGLNLVQTLLGRSFAPAGAVMPLLGGRLACLFLGILAGGTLTALGKQRRSSRHAVVGGLISLLLDWLLIPGWAQVGAATAALIGQAWATGGCLWDCRQLIRIRGGFLAKVAIACGGMLLTARLLAGAGWLAAAVAAGLAYLALLALLRAAPHRLLRWQIPEGVPLDY